MEQGVFPTAVTSNINIDGTPSAYIIDYDSLLQDNSDSSGVMVLRFLMRLGVKRVMLAGYDGFTGGVDHYSEKLDSYLSVETVNALNSSMSTQLAEIGNSLTMEFLTPSVYGDCPDD
jgi:4-hydroxy 2-oxovalerate aldolase